MKKMTMVVVMVLAIIIISVPAMAQEEESSSMFSGTAEIGASTKYVDEISGSPIYDDPTARTYAELDHKSGLYAAVKGYKKIGSEFDNPSLYIGYNHDVVFYKWDIGYAYYGEYDLHGFYANINFPKIGKNLTPFLSVEVDFPNNEEAGDGGVLYRTGVKTAVEVFEQSILLEASVGGHDGAWGTRPELVSYARISANTVITLVEEVAEIVPEAHYQKSLGYAPAGEDDESAGGMTNNEFWAGAKVVFYF